MENAYVILLHGLGRTWKIMATLSRFLERYGYTPVNIDYSSTRFPIADLTDQLAEKIAAACLDPQKTIHFVGHSLGSVLAHFYIKKYHPARLGRVVALGPPYHGSAIIDHLSKYFWYKKLHGPAALELHAAEPSLYSRLGAANYDLGVIAGDRWIFWDWFFANYWLKKPNDGKVEVASTRIEGCRDHIILPVNHVCFPNYPIVHQQVYYFLVHGNFNRT